MRIKSFNTIFHHLNNYVSKGCNYKFRHVTLLSIQKNFSNWHIVGALCLERKPVITQELTPLEQRYCQYLQKEELEKSYLSDHEKRHLEDLRIAEKIKKGDLEGMDHIAKQTAQDMEDAGVEQLNKYQPSPRITDADKNNDQRSLQRKLDSSLLLVVKQKLGNDFRWILPQTVHRDGETLRQTAERAFLSLCPDHRKLMFMGNAPVGYYKYKYPKMARGNGICGAKVFFFKAQVIPKKTITLDVKQAEDISDALWLTHAELNDVLQPDYAKTVQSFLFPDSFDVDYVHNSNSSYVDEPALKSSALN